MKNITVTMMPPAISIMSASSCRPRPYCGSMLNAAVRWPGFHPGKDRGALCCGSSTVADQGYPRLAIAGSGIAPEPHADTAAEALHRASVEAHRDLPGADVAASSALAAPPIAPAAIRAPGLESARHPGRRG
jgi:hypothetical protein